MSENIEAGVAGGDIEDVKARGALYGIRVLDFTQMMLGPLATQLLADLGADVIKVERPGVGEWIRAMPIGGELVGGDSAAFLSMNRNKRSIAIDLKHPSARDLLLEVGGKCDVIAENFRPGVMNRLGLGYEDFKAVRPDIVYASGSGWGQRSELARQKRPGQDLLVQAMSGVMFNTGRSVDPPTPCGTPVADFAASQSLATGILTALLARERLGVGQRVEADLYSSLLAAQCQENFAVLNQSSMLSRSEAGIAATWTDAPYGVYETSEGWIAIAMCPLATLGDLVGDQSIGRLDPWADRDAVKRRLDVLMKSKTTEEWLELFLAADIWSAPVRTSQEAMAELEALDSELLVTMAHPISGSIKAIACAVGLSKTPATVRRPPPMVGAHTNEVMTELFGRERAASLRLKGVFGDVE